MVGKRVIYILFFLYSLVSSYAQGYSLQAYIKNLGDHPVTLSAYDKSEFVRIDSTFSLDGNFYFLLGEFLHPGLYALDFWTGDHDPGIIPDVRFEFIFNHENIEILATDLHNIPGTSGISGSKENNLYYEFLEQQYYYNRDSVSMAYAGYLEAVEQGSDPEGAREDFLSMQKRWDDYLVTLAGQNSDLYTSRIIMASRFPVIDPEAGGWKKNRYHFFDRSPINDSLLLYHPVYFNRIDDFLSLFYTGPESDTILPDKEYLTAIDIIMANVSEEPEIRNTIVEYLLKVFERYNNEIAQIYITDNYLDERCESDIVELVLSRMEGYRRMQPGNRAPDIVIRDRFDQTVRLDQVDNKYVLVMFWASTCEHCRKMVPKIHQWYLTENNIDLEVFSVSIDTTRSQWEAFIDEYDLTWILAYEPLGWYGKAARDYYVYATPSLFLLDNKRRIISKPFTYREFLRAVKQL